ncbi:MAG: MFS transporter, partial [Chloroflexi bacterium]|nr:MFS transporter [Chloroflexota bacterium]
MTATSNRKQIAILSFVLVVVMLGYGIVIPIIPFYIEHLGAGGSELGLLVASYALMRLICGPIWGGLSDRVGRKPILLIGVLGYGITMVLFGLATELWMLFAARILSGILSSATAPTTMAYISDSTSEENRGGGMGILGAAVGLGTILGPGLGGLLAGDSLALPFFIAGGLSFVALALAILFLPESLPAHERQRPAEGAARIVDLGEMWRAIFSPIGSLLLMAFLVAYGMTIFYGIFGLYALKKFEYGPQEVGTILMVIGLASAVAQGALTGPLTRRWGEARVIKGMMLLAAGGFLIMLLAYSYLTVLLTTGLFVLVTAVLGPAITSLTSKWATMKQGIAMGLNNSFFSLGRIAGPLWGGIVLDMNVDYPYLSGAAVMFIGFL